LQELNSVSTHIPFIRLRMLRMTGLQGRARGVWASSLYQSKV
jgi:hypothetical protein